MPTSGQTLYPNRPGEKNTRAPRLAGALMCTSHPPVAVRSSRGRAASDKAPGTLSIPQLWSCADNPRENGESCESILVLLNVIWGKQEVAVDGECAPKIQRDRSQRRLLIDSGEPFLNHDVEFTFKSVCHSLHRASAGIPPSHLRRAFRLSHYILPNAHRTLAHHHFFERSLTIRYLVGSSASEL